MGNTIQADGQMGPNIKHCKVDDNFGQAREWLMYEVIAYFMQLFQLILFVLSAEFKDKNIYEQDADRFTKEEIMIMVN